MLRLRERERGGKSEGRSSVLREREWQRIRETYQGVVAETVRVTGTYQGVE